nr:unnamed protein product [Digitaria exilis]
MATQPARGKGCLLFLHPCRHRLTGRAGEGDAVACVVPAYCLQDPVRKGLEIGGSAPTSWAPLSYQDRRLDSRPVPHPSPAPLPPYSQSPDRLASSSLYQAGRISMKKAAGGQGALQVVSDSPILGSSCWIRNSVGFEFVTASILDFPVIPRRREFGSRVIQYRIMRVGVLFRVVDLSCWKFHLVGIMAPPKPSAQTQFVLTKMDERAAKGDERWEQVLENMDLLFAQVGDIAANQQTMAAQISVSTKVMEQMIADQKLLNKRIDATGQAQDGGPSSPTSSVDQADPREQKPAAKGHYTLPNLSRQVTRGYPPLLLHPCVRFDTFPCVAALYSVGSMRLSLSMPCCNY